MRRCTRLGTGGRACETAQSPAGLLPQNGRERTGQGTAATVGPGRAAGNRDGLSAGAMAVASRHAAMSSDVPWPMGDSNGLADEARGARIAVPRHAARIHHGYADHAGSGPGSGAAPAEATGAMSREDVGSSIDEFVTEEGILEEAQTQAAKEVVAWPLAEVTKRKEMLKSRMAILPEVSRSEVDRLLGPKNDITVRSLQRAAVVGCRVNGELV